MDIRQFQDEDIDPRRFITPALVVIFAILVLLLLFNSYYTVQPNEEAVVMRFGKYQATAPPGLHYRIPLVDEVLKVSVEDRSVRLPFGTRSGRPAGAPEREDETLMLTGDLNAASVEWTMQWKISDPKKYLFSFHDPHDPRGQSQAVERVILTAARTKMNQLVGDYSIDEVLTTKRTDIEESALQQTRELLEQYNCGVLIRDVQLQRVTPPERVKPAWDAIVAAQQRQDQLESEAYKEREKMLAEARAEKNQKIQSANGYADRRLAEVNGEISALEAKYSAYKRAPDVTRKRLYLESMQDIFSGVETKVVIDSDLKQILPLLQLEQGAQQ